jgi:hypothetical protein
VTQDVKVLVFLEQGEEGIPDGVCVIHVSGGLVTYCIIYSSAYTPM